MSDTFDYEVKNFMEEKATYQKEIDILKAEKTSLQDIFVFQIDAIKKAHCQFQTDFQEYASVRNDQLGSVKDGLLELKVKVCSVFDRFKRRPFKKITLIDDMISVITERMEFFLE